MTDALSAQKAPCPFCGGSAFAWGGIGERTDLQEMQFRPRARGIAKSMLGIGTERVTARKCAGCGNVQMFADPGA